MAERLKAPICSYRWLPYGARGFESRPFLHVPTDRMYSCAKAVGFEDSEIVLVGDGKRYGVRVPLLGIEPRCRPFDRQTHIPAVGAHTKESA